MALIATLVTSPAQKVLTTDLIDAARRAGGEAGELRWLAPHQAAEFQLAGEAAQTRAHTDARRQALRGAPVDVVVQDAKNQRKTLLLADMDSTMIAQECIDELADFAGIKAHVAAITERAMRGELDFAPALRERVALLKGLPVSVVDEVLNSRITLTHGGIELVRTMRAHGAYTCLVSGGFTLFTEQVAARCGFDENRANLLIIEGAHFAGDVVEPILGREAKLATLRDLRDRHGVDVAATLVVGDGANDLDMIHEAGLGVAFHAKPAVAQAADARIDHGDLTALLYAQGYHRDEFVSA